MKKYIYILIVLALPIILVSAGKGDFMTMLHKYLNIYNTKYPQEKIYIQTDKTYYKPTDNIWYKAFLIDANKNIPSTTSGIIYVELLDPKGNRIGKNDHSLLDGTTNGNFKIDENQPGGIYKLRAYSKWIENWGEEAIFTKEITVQKVITPRLLLKLDFEKRAYGPGDEVVANLLVTDLNNNKTTGSIATSTIRIGGVVIETVTHETDLGKADIKFILPQDLNTADGILQIMVSDRGTEESITRSIPIVLSKIDLKFYPEGGEMVANTPNKVAFEALNEFGKGADISGYIVDDTDKRVCDFSSFHLGMGAFDFTPQKGRKYFAKIEAPLGNNELIALPEASENNYVLSLKLKGDTKLQWSVYSPHKTSAYLVGQTQGEIYYNTKLDLKKGINLIETSLDQFPVGIAVFTLFDNKNIAACERLVFVNADKGLHISIDADKEVYEPGQKANFTINTKDKNGNPVSASLGLAVVDEQLMTFADDKQDNMLSYVLFSSELKGKIQEPYFYFDPTQEKSKEAIDYLMLTHGWRRFVWSDIITEKQPEIQNKAENNSTVYGYVLNKEGNPVQADVYLIEESDKNRIGAVRTTREGHFAFRNIDSGSNNFITTKLPNQVYLFSNDMQIENSSGHIVAEDDLTLNVNDIIKLPETNVSDIAISETEEPGIFPLFSGEDKAMTAFRDGDDLLLDEVVIMAYGSQKKSSVIGSVRVVNRDDAMISVTQGNIASILGGAVPGLIVSPQGTSADLSQNITIRGTSSIISGSNPLVVLDGVPLFGTLASALSHINPNEIESISVQKDPSITSIYGSRAANGVIILNRKKQSFNNRKTIKEKPKFGGVYIKKRLFYQPGAFEQNDDKGENVSTVYWNGNITTNSEGVAKVSFNNAIHSSTFRITAEGLAKKSGLIGSATEKIVTRKPFSIDTKTPLFVGIGDKVNVPVMVRNATADSMFAAITATMQQDMLLIDDDGKQSDSGTIYTTIPPNEATTVYFSVTTGTTAGVCNMHITGEVGKHKSDVLERRIVVRQINFPYQYNFSGRDEQQTESFELPDYVAGTLQAEAVSYSDVTDELFDGVESIFREPYGCFEQVSSSTFPNIFALQLLQNRSDVKEDVRTRALQYLENGYKKLAAYEVKGGGFEWYGGTPAHEVLSAYGLVQFHEMNKVYPKVDQKMVDRTLKYLLGRRDGKGGFHQNRGKYGFSGSPKNVSNAYIVYAMTETSNTDKIEKEYEVALQEAFSSKDLYRMALMANAAHNKGDMANYIKLVQLFKDYTNANKELGKFKIEASIVYSYGEAANRETIAFWMIALLKAKDSPDKDLIEECLAYISKGRSGGSFGNTQATSICLQALTKYTEMFYSQMETGSKLYFNVNGANLYKNIAKTKTVIPFSKELVNGKNIMQIKYVGSKTYFPYSVNISWQSKTPPTSKLCPLVLTTRLANATTKVNETVRLAIKLTNKDNEAKPMTVAVIGIPGGMSLQPWQLKELQEKEVFDFYEIINDNLVLYYREMGPKEVKLIDIDLKAEISGTYTGVASSAYIYYMNDHKYWIDGISTTIGK